MTQILYPNWKEDLTMELTDKQVAHIVDSVAIRLGVTGLVTVHRPANRDNLLVIQLQTYEFGMESNATEDDIRKRAKKEFGGAQKV
jgi:hypothetical protein